MKRLLAAASVALALAAPSPAAAEAIPGAADDALLAVGPSGSPYVALADGASLDLWSATGGRAPLAALPGSGAELAGLAIDPRGRAVVLVEAQSGGWLELVRGHTRYRLATGLGRGSVLGLAGLALGAGGRPIVSYAWRTRSGRTFLRLAALGATGRVSVRAVTSGGFPDSDSAPASVPLVLPRGRIDVVETFSAGGSEAIEWMPAGRSWLGQFLYSSVLGTSFGPVLAGTGASKGVLSAWTVGYPQGESDVLLASFAQAEQQTTVVVSHALLRALVLAQTPELAVNDWVDAGQLGLGGGELDFAGQIASLGAAPVELDGALLGYAAAGGRRVVLLRRAAGLELFETPSTPSVRLTLDAARAGSAVALTGTVSGRTSGAVALYRERPGERRQLVATASLQPDGSFAAADPAPTLPAFYRAVYADPGTGLPYGALLRAPVEP